MLARVLVLLALVVFRPVSGNAMARSPSRLPLEWSSRALPTAMSTDYPDTDKADAEALKKCRDTTIAACGRSAK